MLTANQAREYLSGYDAITGAGTVYTAVTSVARSGMSRRIKVYVVDSGEIRNITHLVAAFLDYSSDPDRGMLVRGCGMDMGFHVVYSLSRAYFGLTHRPCPDHPGQSFHYSSGACSCGKSHPDAGDPGYLLTQRWL